MNDESFVIGFEMSLHSVTKKCGKGGQELLETEPVLKSESD